MYVGFTVDDGYLDVRQGLSDLDGHVQLAEGMATAGMLLPGKAVCRALKLSAPELSSSQAVSAPQLFRGKNHDTEPQRNLGHTQRFPVGHPPGVRSFFATR
ncbi:hypothetical protein GCM10007862_06010 [Dyella lipolytica]|nr:hypothetical protein GCM10007862_06010 [Dyella lipolytica]